MRFVRLLPFAIALALAGCFLTSGQFVVSFDLPDQIDVPSPDTVIPLPIDLNTVGVYNDHKQDISNIADVALLGDLENRGSTPIEVEFWMRPTLETTPTPVTAAAIRNDPTAVRVWGPLSLPGNSTLHIGWDQSAGLFSGRQALLTEVKGDGAFTLYALGPSGAGSYSFSVHKGLLVVTVDAGV
jgi:hypothetical protein